MIWCTGRSTKIFPTYPLPERKGDFYTLFQSQRSKKHTLLGGTYPYSPYMGVPPREIPSPQSSAPPIGNDIPLLKNKFCFQSNKCSCFQRQLCRNETFRLLLKTLLKELFANKGKILSCKFVKPCKNRKNSRAYYTLEQEINLVQIPHPSKATFKFPPLRARCTVKCPGYARGGGGGGMIHDVPLPKRKLFLLNNTGREDFLEHIFKNFESW